MINFEELYTAGKEPLPSGIPTRSDHFNRRQRALMTSSQVHTDVKGKAPKSDLLLT